MTLLMFPHARGLTQAQRQVLLSMNPDGPCDAWLVSRTVLTLYLLDYAGLIARGKRGWCDAVLTKAGQRLRRELEAGAATDWREAAE